MLLDVSRAVLTAVAGIAAVYSLFTRSNLRSVFSGMTCTAALSMLLLLDQRVVEAVLLLGVAAGFLLAVGFLAPFSGVEARLSEWRAAGIAAGVALGVLLASALSPVVEADGESVDWGLALALTGAPLAAILASMWLMMGGEE